MICTYARSSSLGTLDWCEHQYFLLYNIGLPSRGSIAADKGTVCHKVLECLGYYKHCLQNGTDHWEDDNFGVMFLHDCEPMALTELAYRYYTKQSSALAWKESDLEDCKKWVNMALSFNSGYMDPRNQDIFALEQKFDFEVVRDWSKYKYPLLDGTFLEGYMALKGTIDLITKEDDKTLHIIDYKTGKRIDWATGKEKTQDSLFHDKQLRLYHYAVSHMFPQYDTVMVTIFYIRSGGPFTVCFTKDDLKVTEDMLRTKFEKIWATQVPKLDISWKCSKLCPFSKPSEHDPSKTTCEFFRDKIKKDGMDATLYELADWSRISTYGSGGGRK